MFVVSFLVWWIVYALLQTSITLAILTIRDNLLHYLSAFWVIIKSFSTVSFLQRLFVCLFVCCFVFTKLCSGCYKFLVGFQSFSKAHSDSIAHLLLAFGKEWSSIVPHSTIFDDIIVLQTILGSLFFCVHFRISLLISINNLVVSFPIKLFTLR